METKLQRWHTEPTIQKILLNQMANKKTDLKQNTTRRYQEWLQQATREQQQIGWEKIWQGFFTQSWGDIQENHYRTKKLPNTNTGANWIKNVIQHIWEYILELWKTRNAKIHDNLKTKAPQKKSLSRN